MSDSGRTSKPSLALKAMPDESTPDKTQNEATASAVSRICEIWVNRLKPQLKKTGYRIYRLGGETLSVVIALSIALLFFAGGLLSRQSADLTALRPNFEQWFSQGFQGSRAELGDLELQWNPSDDTLSFTVTDIVVYDEGDTVVQHVPSLKATMPKSSLLQRRATLSDIEIIGGTVTWRETSDGRIIAGLGTPETVGRFGPVYRGQSASDDEQNGLLDSANLDWLSEFQSLSLKESRAYIVRETDGVDIVLAVDSLEGARNDGQVDLNVETKLVSKSGDSAGRLSLQFDSQDNFSVSEMSLKTTDLRPARVAPETGRLSVFNALDVPIDLTFSFDHSQDEGLRSARLDMMAGSGTVDLAGETRSVQSARFKGSLEAGDEEMRVDTLTVNADRLVLNGQGIIRQIGRWDDGDVGTSPKFDLNLTDSRLDLRPVFEKPLSIKRAEIVGELDLDARSLDIDRLVGDFPGFSLETRGQIVTQQDGLSKIALSGTTLTPMTAPQLLSLWPVKFADGARRWIDNSVMGGTANNVDFRINLDEAFFANPQLTSDRLQLTFDVQDGIVRYISTMSPLVEAFGSGRIDGNRLGMVLESGRINDVQIVGGDVDIPTLTPKGGNIFMSANAKGQAQDLFALINQPPFQYLDRYGVDPNGFSGDAEITLNIKRPLLEYFDQNRIEYSVEGKFQNAKAPFQMGGYGLDNGDVTIRGGKEGLFVEGEADLGPWRANIAWAERYGLNGEPTRYRIFGPMNQKVLDGFGLPTRRFFGGTIDVDLEAIGTGLTVTEALVDIGLDNAELAFGDIWAKPAGDTGKAQLTLSRQGDRVSVPSLSVNAPGLELGGTVTFRDGFALEEARLEVAKIESLINGQMVLARDDIAGRLSLNATGRSLNLSAFVQEALANFGQGQQSIPMALDASFETITLSEDYAVNEAVMAYRHNGTAIEQMSINGNRPGGVIRVSLGEDETNIRRASISIPDVSEASSKILGLNATRGGSLNLEATLPRTGESGPVIGDAIAKDFVVENAPFLAKILSLASLTGFVDTMSGSGLAFNELVFDFALEDQILRIRDAKLRGAAIGMTGEGDIDIAEKAIDFSGALVPSYTANSLLGDIPVLGDLLIGKDGEGVFAVTYSVEGPFSQALIAINPLSALTPGFIRGIFRENRDDIPKAAIEDIESVRPEPVQTDTEN